MSDKKVPEKCTEQERWIVNNRVCAIRVDYEQTGTDTAETFVTLTDETGSKVKWMAHTFRKVARIELGHAYIAEPLPGLREKVKAWEAYEKSNQRDLNDYKRLYEQFGGMKP